SARAGLSQTSGRAANGAAAIAVAEREILALERAWMVDAYLRHDAPALERELAREFTLTFRDGKLYDRTHELTSLRSAAPEPASVSYRLEDQQVRIYGDAAVTTGRFISLRDGKPVAESRYTNTYIRRDGQWLAVASQFTGVRTAW